MAAISMYSFTREDIEDNAQGVKSTLLTTMLKSGDISEEVYREYKNNCAVLCREPGFFSSFWDKMFKKDEEPKLTYIVVRQLSLSEDDFVIETKEEKPNKGEEKNGKE